MASDLLFHQIALLSDITSEQYLTVIVVVPYDFTVTSAILIETMWNIDPEYEQRDKFLDLTDADGV